MNIASTPTFRSIRVLLVTLALALASTAGFASGVSADVLTPLEEIGAPGGGSGIGNVTDEAPQARAPYVTY